LAVVPLYFWAADLFGPPTAVAAVGLYALTPSLLVFSPMTDLLYVPLAVGVLAMLHLGLARRDPAQLAFGGVIAWLALQCTLAFLVVLFVLAVYVALEAVAERRYEETLKLLAWPVGVFAALTILFWVVPLRYNSLLVWKLCITNNASFNTGRTFLPWLLLNPLDFLLFLGVPTAVLLVREVVRAARRRGEVAARRFIVALVVTLLLLNATGTNRGEVARLWMPLMPMATAIAASALRANEDEEGRDWMFPVVFAVLWLQAVLFRLSLDVLLPP
jgi:hypothetical protein